MKIIQRTAVPQSYSFNSKLTISKNSDSNGSWITKSLSGQEGRQYSEARLLLYRASAWENSQCHSLTNKEYYHENIQF